MTEPTPLFLSDEPLSDAFRFNADRIVGALFDLIVSAKTDAPLNICISGGWGAGKTTILRTLQRKFAEHRDSESLNDTIHVPLWFDPWKLSNEIEVRESLTRRIMALVESDTDFLKRTSISVDRKNIVRLLSERLLKISPDQVDAFYRANSLAKGSFDEVEELFRRVASTYLDDSDARRRLIVFVDDLDRCRPPRVVEVLEAVKLFFDLPGIVFLFALDRDQVEEAVATAYAFPVERSRVYLEKIFQLTFVLPRKGAADLADFVGQNLSQLGITLHDKALAMAIVNRFGRNLRNLKLFINSFSLQRHLVRDPLQEFDDELLFKWLYLETTMPRSITEAFKEGSLNMVIAFEFLAFGGFLYDAPRHNHYVRVLGESAMNFVELVALAMLPPGDDALLSKARLPAQKQAILTAVQADGDIPAMLGVLREGRVRLLDEDLRSLALLTRRDDLAMASSSPHALQNEADSSLLSAVEDGDILHPMARSDLAGSDWDTYGDRLRERGDYRSAFVAYLMAVLCKPDSQVYLGDLAKVLRSLGRVRASMALLRQAYDMNPRSAYIDTELGYLYDVTLGDKEVGSLWYWSAMAHGAAIAAIPSNLSLNLTASGDSEMAYLAAVDAYLREPNDVRRKTLLNRARTSGRSKAVTDTFDEDCQADLDSATREGRYPYKLDFGEEARLAALVETHPLLSDSIVVNELSRPPIAT